MTKKAHSCSNYRLERQYEILTALKDTEQTEDRVESFFTQNLDMNRHLKGEAFKPTMRSLLPPKNWSESLKPGLDSSQDTKSDLMSYVHILQEEVLSLSAKVQSQAKNMAVVEHCNTGARDALASIKA